MYGGTVINMKPNFYSDEYAKLKHRFNQLKSRIILDNGPEQETAIRLLKKVENKLLAYEKKYGILRESESSTTSMGYTYYQSNPTMNANNHPYNSEANTQSYQNMHFERRQQEVHYEKDTRSEQQIATDLGILYVIFGSTYCTFLNYHTYKIRFIRKTDKQSAFYRVYADIYEDDIRICHNIIIGFWPWNYGNDRCGDMQMASSDDECFIGKYYYCYDVYTVLLNKLKDLWNSYFDNQSSVPLISSPIRGYLGNFSLPKTQLSKKQREAIIEKVRLENHSRDLNELKRNCNRYIIYTDKKFRKFQTFLENSGVVYQVQEDGIYIFDCIKESYGKLMGMQFQKGTYIVYLV